MAICKSATERGLEKEGDRHEQKERETPDFIKALPLHHLFNGARAMAFKEP